MGHGVYFIANSLAKYDVGQGGEREMSYTIIPCTIKNVTELQLVASETFEETFSEQNTEANMKFYIERAFSLTKLEEELRNPHSQFYFICVNQEVAGYLKINLLDAQTEPMGAESLEVERIYVRKAYQQDGLGKALMIKAVEIAQQLKCKKVWLGVWEKNEHAIEFYERFGFTKQGTHIFLMGDEQQTDYMMVKPL